MALFEQALGDLKKEFRFYPMPFNTSFLFDLYIQYSIFFSNPDVCPSKIRPILGQVHLSSGRSIRGTLPRDVVTNDLGSPH